MLQTLSPSHLFFSMLPEKLFSARAIHSFLGVFGLPSPAVGRFFCFFGANRTNPDAASIWLEIIKFARENMASLAVDLSGVPSRRAIASEYILSERDKLKVVRITAPSVPAKMVNLRNIFSLAARYFSDLPCVKHSMCRFYLSLVCSSAVSTLIYVSNPIPASRIFVNRDSGHKPGFLFGRWFYNKVVRFCFHKEDYITDEPGSHGRSERVDDIPSDIWRSEVPNLDVRHNYNLTPSRWRTDQFRDQRNCRNWQEADSVQGWYEEGRFQDLLEGVGERGKEIA